MKDDQKDLDDWINQVYYGSCCSHPDEDSQKRIDISGSRAEKSCENDQGKPQKDLS